MPHDPERIAETQEWLDKVSLDLRGARIDLDAVPPLLEDALFHCQQAVEKSLKAFLAWAFRYPGDHPVPTIKEARQGFSTAMKTVAAVIARLPKETVPPALRDQTA
jgi:HEPN domain-containing protein